MKKSLIFIILFFSTFCLYSDNGSDLYQDALTLSDSLFYDENTGLTTFPTLLIPIGGKYESMGTAYTAVVSDSGYIEANPAGSAVLQETELTFLHNNWIADSNLEGVVYTTRFNNLGIGFGGKFLYVPFTEYNDWGEKESKGYFSETIATANIAYNFFSSYSFFGMAAGVNLKAGYRNIPTAIYPDQSILTGMADVGILTRFNFAKFYPSRSKNFSFGAVVKNLGPPSNEEPLPTALTTGIAYSPIRPLTVAVDFNLPFNLDFVTPAEKWSLAGGFDITFTDFISLQGGFRYRGANPRISLGTNIITEKITFNINYTMDLTTQLGVPLDRFSIAAKLHLGDRGRAERSKTVDDLYLNGLESYAKGNLNEAIAFWEKALELDPGFTPAKESIETAKRALALQDEMKSIQVVE
jgi:hypothetical protein